MIRHILAFLFGVWIVVTIRFIYYAWKDGGEEDGKI